MSGVTLPILPVQILWINMTTAVLLGLMLAFAPGETDTMKYPPRAPDAPILSGIIMIRILLVSALLLGAVFSVFVWQKASGYPLAEARTVAVNLFVMIELTYLFNCRSLTKSMFENRSFHQPLGARRQRHHDCPAVDGHLRAVHESCISQRSYFR